MRSDHEYIKPCHAEYAKLCTTLLPNFLSTYSIQVVSIYSIRVENSVDPDQMASLEASWSGSTMFSKKDNTGFSWIRVKIVWWTESSCFCIACSAKLHPFMKSTDKFWDISRDLINYSLWAMTRDFQQCGILTSVDSDEPVQPSCKFRNSKWCSVSNLTLIEYSSDKQRLWSDCVYTQAGLRLCWSYVPDCWKSYVKAHMWLAKAQTQSCQSLPYSLTESMEVVKSSD